MANRRARPAWFGIGIGMCLVFLAATALADSNARIVRLSYAEGDVRLDRGDGRGFEQGLMNMPVAHGNRVWTRSEALAEVEFEDGDTVRLTPETLLILQQLALRSNGVRISVVELQEGEAYFRLRHNDDNDFRILLPGRELELRKSSHLRLAVRGQQVELAVIKGEVEIRGQGERLLVKKGETLTLDPNDADRYYLARSVEEGSYDQWDKDRDSYRDRYASSSNSGGYSPHYSYGVSDLHYYGGYFNHPGYGQLWRPYYVNYGWSPFDNGAWVFYPGSGYIWVSAYPWGWMPYRYGSWYHVSGYGWCWRRGNSWNQWSSYTRVHHAPRHYRGPVAPQERNGGIVNVGGGAQPIFPDNDRGERGAPSRRVFQVAGNDVNSGNKGTRGREGITPFRPSVAAGDDAVNRAGKGTTDRGGITPFRPADTAGDDASNRAGKGARDRGGITPHRLPAAGDADSEVVGKRSSGQPIVFPRRSTPSGDSDNAQPQPRDSSGGMRRGYRESTGGDSGSNNRTDSRSNDRSNDQQRDRAVDSDRSSTPGRRSYTSDAPQSESRGSQRQSTPRAEPSGSSSAVRSSSPSPSPSRSYNSGSSSPARSSSSGSSSPSRSSSGNSGGGGRSSGSSGGGGNSGGGASRGSSSSSSSKSTTR